MLLDFSSLETCNETLSKLLTIPLNRIDDIVKPHCNDDISPYINTEVFSNINDLSTTFYHFATSEGSESFERNGIVNLQEVLSSDNFLNKFLAEKNIKFDVERKLLFFREKQFSLEVKNDDILKPIERRIYYDYNVNGFYLCDPYSPSRYSIIDNEPEFLNSILSVVIRNQPSIDSIIDEWRKRTNLYLVKAIVPFYKIDLNTDKEDFPLFIVSKLIDIFLAKSSTLKTDDRYIVYLKREEKVASNEIKSITKLN